ncbi:sensor histidine kinase [Nocardia sp. NBC_01503]|uniref:sensor histidine kinase n=1 Tax=Nocardia sp. NBC_01503 TaxID=2975997 RepID=UPI002E7ACE25|nr:sensor histidine kinase [Nocardia sp. NBC_01503]WTL29405.1 sensor histidine kinase [Nocardia sp. NBC_01503]
MSTLESGGGPTVEVADLWGRRTLSWPAVASGTVEDSPESITRRRRLGWVFAAVWSVYLIAPLRTAWALDTAAARVYTLTVIIAFGLAYIGSYWYLLRSPSIGPIWPSPPRRTIFLMLAVQLAFLVAIAVTLHGQAARLGIYLASFIAFTLPIPQGIATLSVVMLATSVVPQLIAGSPPDYDTLESMAMAAFAVGGIRQLIQRNQQLNIARLQLTELAIAEERLRVGRDVHDILGHSLTVITVKTELAQRLLEVDPERAKQELADVERLARESLAGVRSTVGGLREVSLAGELGSARTALRAAEIEADLPDSDTLPARHSVVFGWVLREAVTNIVRHSGARHAIVRVTPTSIEVSDDGGGLGDAGYGSGLTGLSERVRAAGGALTVANRPEGGLRVLASFPAEPMGDPR